jgi:hypothetical protein
VSKFSPQIATSLRLIKAKGQAMPLIRLALGDQYNPLEPTESSPQEINRTTAYGVSLPSNKSTLALLRLDDHILDDPALRQSFRFYLLAAAGLSFEPRAHDVLLASEGPLRILSLTPLDPAGDGAIVYNVGATLDDRFTFEPDQVKLSINDGEPLAFID